MTRDELIQDLRNLSDAMLDTATNLTYFGGMDDELQLHSRQLVGASALVVTWVNGLEAEGEKQ